MKKIVVIMMLSVISCISYANFRGISWGTSRQKAIRLIDKKPEYKTANTDYWREKLFGYVFHLNFNYKNNRLYRAGYCFVEKGMHIKVFKILRKQLLKKYGRPFHSYTENNGVKVERNLPINEKDFYAGKFETGTEWRTKKTVVFLILSSKRDKGKIIPQLQLMYFEKNSFLYETRKVQDKARRRQLESIKKL